MYTVDQFKKLEKAKWNFDDTYNLFGDEEDILEQAVDPTHSGNIDNILSDLSDGFTPTLEGYLEKHKEEIKPWISNNPRLDTETKVLLSAFSNYYKDLCELNMENIKFNFLVNYIKEYDFEELLSYEDYVYLYNIIVSYEIDDFDILIAEVNEIGE